MIHRIGQIMLYVNDQEKSLRFWTEKAGFHLIHEEELGDGFKWIEIAPSQNAGTSLILHNKDLIARMEPELNLGTPSLMFFTENLDALRKDYLEKKIIVGEVVSMPSGRVFNFADDEGNYFAVMEKK